MQRARTIEAKEKRREALLAAALDEFIEKGFAPARMDDIAKRAGLSKGTLYLYFDSKDALFESLVTTHALPNVEKMEQVLAQFDGFRPALDALMTMAPHLIRNTDMPRLMKVLIANSSAFPETVLAYRQQVIDRVLALITKLIERGQASGEVHCEDAGLTARLVIAPIVMSGIWHMVFAQAEGGAFDMDKLFLLHGRYLQAALLEHGGAS